MSNFSDFFPAAGGGGGGTPKFQEFTTSGTFTPTQALIDAGGYIDVFIVGGGGQSGSSTYGASGGETIFSRMYLTSTTACIVTIGAGGGYGGGGGNSSAAFSSAGGSDVTALGGAATQTQSLKMGAGFGSMDDKTAGSGVLGYGVGAGRLNVGQGGIFAGKANSGQGSGPNQVAGSGYCLIKWQE